MKHNKPFSFAICLLLLAAILCVLTTAAAAAAAAGIQKTRTVPVQLLQQEWKTISVSDSFGATTALKQLLAVQCTAQTTALMALDTNGKLYAWGDDFCASAFSLDTKPVDISARVSGGEKFSLVAQGGGPQSATVALSQDRHKIFAAQLYPQALFFERLAYSEEWGKVSDASTQGMRVFVLSETGVWYMASTSEKSFGHAVPNSFGVFERIEIGEGRAVVQIAAGAALANDGTLFAVDDASGQVSEIGLNTQKFLPTNNYKLFVSGEADRTKYVLNLQTGVLLAGNSYGKAFEPVSLGLDPLLDGINVDSASILFLASNRSDVSPGSSPASLRQSLFWIYGQRAEALPPVPQPFAGVSAVTVFCAHPDPIFDSFNVPDPDTIMILVDEGRQVLALGGIAQSLQFLAGNTNRPALGLVKLGLIAYGIAFIIIPLIALILSIARWVLTFMKFAYVKEKTADAGTWSATGVAVSGLLSGFFSGILSAANTWFLWSQNIMMTYISIALGGLLLGTVFASLLLLLFGCIYSFTLFRATRRQNGENASKILRIPALIVLFLLIPAGLANPIFSAVVTVLNIGFFELKPRILEQLAVTRPVDPQYQPLLLIGPVVTILASSALLVFVCEVTQWGRLIAMGRETKRREAEEKQKKKGSGSSRYNELTELPEEF